MKSYIHNISRFFNSEALSHKVSLRPFSTGIAFPRTVYNIKHGVVDFLQWYEDASERSV